MNPPKVLAEAVRRLTSGEAEEAVLLRLTRTRTRWGQLYDVSKETGYAYDTVIQSLSNLTRKGLAKRLRRGVYEANWRPILEAMSVVVKEREMLSDEFG